MAEDESNLPPADAPAGIGRKWWKWLLAAYCIVLFTATHLPPRTPLLPGAYLDKVAHFSAYALLAFLIACYWQSSAGWLGREHFLWIAIACAIVAVIDELLQIPVGRECSFFDWLADTLGALSGIAAFAAWRRYRHSRT